jgi:hypothetical protein
VPPTGSAEAGGRCRVIANGQFMSSPQFRRRAVRSLNDAAYIGSDSLHLDERAHRADLSLHSPGAL